MEPIQTADHGVVAPSPPARSRGRWLVEWVAIVAVAIVLALALRAYVVQSFSIPSDSMVPALKDHDRILVDKVTYHFRAVRTGDIVVFGRPPRENCGDVSHLVKRVIGLPGQRISSVGNTVWINGKPLAEPWLPKFDPLGRPIRAQTIPRNRFFVMGDNRSNSCDSRYWGTVPRSLIVGEVRFRVWPLDRFHLF